MQTRQDKPISQDEWLQIRDCFRDMMKRLLKSDDSFRNGEIIYTSMRAVALEVEMMLYAVEPEATKNLRDRVEAQDCMERNRK